MKSNVNSGTGTFNIAPVVENLKEDNIGIFRKLFEGSNIAFFTCDKEGYLTYYNKAAASIWGKSPKTGKTYWHQCLKIFYPDGRSMPPMESPFGKTLLEGVAYEDQKIRIKRIGNSYSHFLTFSRPLFDEHNNLTGSHNTLVDITGRQEDSLKQARLSAIVESSDDAIIGKDLNGCITSWNSGAQRIFGYTEKEMLGKSVTFLIPDDRLQEEANILQQLRRGKKIDHFETIRKDKYGRNIHISLTVSPIRDDRGKIVGASKVARDISSKIEAEAQIKKYNHNLEIINSIGKSISENLDLQVILQRVTDATTKLTGAAFGAFFYNNIDEQGASFRLFTLSGAPRESFEKLGMPRHTDIFLPTFAEGIVLRLDDVRKDSRYGQNLPHGGMPGGHLPVVSYLAVPVISKSGTIIGALLFGHPESGIFTKEHEEMVVNIAAQAAISLDNSKLFEQVKNLSAKKDEFIALASHELKTPLTTIKGYLQVLAKKESDDMSRLFLTKALEQANKLNNLVEDLLHMSRIEAGRLEFHLEKFDIREMLIDLTETFSYSNKTHTILEDLGEQPVLVEGDRQRIEQALINLITNAIKYSPDADKIYISLKTSFNKVRVQVRDEGLGLTDEQKVQLFTRFYRADNNRGISGLGLGLYLTKQIIDRHQGNIEVKSKLGEGSEFIVTLPLNNKPQ